MNYFSKEDIQNLNFKFKLNLINSISGIKSANLIGSIDQQANLAVFSSVIHIGSDPSLLGFIMRPNTVRRDTYNNIIKNKYFTINNITEKISKQAHYTSAKFDEEISEFNKVNLNEEYKNDFLAPYCKESTLQIGLIFQEEHKISNGCTLIIGKVEQLYIQSNAIDTSGKIDLKQLNTVGISGLNRYYSFNSFKEYPYVRINEVPNFQNPHLKEKPDNVVFDQNLNIYNAGLKKYPTNLGAPAIEVTDLTNWKKIGSQKINKSIESKFNHVKKQFEEIIDTYNWNEIIYNSKFDFEPIIGQTYHLYEKANKTTILSIIGPSEWDLKHIGSFLLDHDMTFKKL